MPRDVQLKIGAFLTNLMCKNLKYKIGQKHYLLLKPQILKESTKKYLGYIIFNKSFIENFIGELDKIHDLNLQLERSLPMIYPPAPWKNFNFGGYYLKQTKMAKVIPNFREALKYL
jgi:DNA-directed RNA polymerase